MSEARDYTTLGELAELNAESLGTTTPRDHTFKYIDLSSVSHGSIDIASSEEFRFVDAPSRARRVVQDGDILFGTVRPQLRSHARVIGDGFVASTGFSVVRPRPGVADGGFLGHFLLSDEAARQAARREVGSNYPAVTEQDVAGFRLPRIPLAEQRRIAEILNTIDEAIQATERTIAKLEMHRQALSQTVFGRRSWHPALGVVAVGSLLVGPPRNGKSPHEGESWSGAFMLGLGCLAATGFAPQQLKWAPEVQGSLRQALLADGDLLMSRSNTADRVGFVGRYRNVGHPCIYPDLMMRLVPRTQVSAQYLELALQSGPARTQVRTLASGTSGSMVKITGEAVSRISVAICSPEDQARICDLFDAVSQARNVEELRCSKLRNLRAGVAPDLLSGRLRTMAA